jgi:signal peptidase I
MTYFSRILVISVSTLLLTAACSDVQDVRDFMPFQNYYAASTSMEPTLPKDTQIMAFSVKAEDVQRGDILIVRTKTGEDYVMRLIALPGDTIAVAAGQIILNGQAVKQEPAGTYTEDDDFRPGPTLRLRERLPGGNPPYFILDHFPETLGDNFEEIALKDDEYFLMGDNRDNSADSRFSDEPYGLGIVAGNQIRRRVGLDSIEKPDGLN